MKALFTRKIEVTKPTFVSAMRHPTVALGLHHKLRHELDSGRVEYSPMGLLAFLDGMPTVLHHSGDRVFNFGTKGVVRAFSAQVPYPALPDWLTQGQATYIELMFHRGVPARDIADWVEAGMVPEVNA